MNKPVIISTTISFVIMYLIARYLGVESRELFVGLTIGMIGSYVMQAWVMPTIKKHWGK